MHVFFSKEITSLAPHIDSFPWNRACKVNINIFLVIRQTTLCKAVFSVSMALMGR